MENPAPRQRVSVWRILGEMAFLSVTLFFAQRAIEAEGWQIVLLRTVVLFILCLHLDLWAFPVGIIVEGLLRHFMNA